MTATSDTHGRYIISPAQILSRFMLTGSVGPSYKANDKFADFPPNIVDMVKSIFDRFPDSALEALVEVVTQNKAAKKPPVILALATALGMTSLRVKAEELASRYIRTATDQFILVKMMQDLGRGKGRSFKRHANILYTNLDTEAGRDKLALNMIKYRNRAGWTHRDLLRVSHFDSSIKNNDLFAWATGKASAFSSHPLVYAYDLMSKAESVEKVCLLLSIHPDLPWEAIPNQFLTSAAVWEALLPNLPKVALIRNLGRMQSLGVPLESFSEKVLASARSLHPVTALSAWKIYGGGQGERGSLSWRPHEEVKAALEVGFYDSFSNLKKSEAKVFFGIDVSGSMSTPSTVTGLSCAEVAAAMAMVAMKQQPYMVYGFGQDLRELGINDQMRLTQVLTIIRSMTYGKTDCSAPMRFCMDQNVGDVDLFAVFTDNETNSSVSPTNALNQYRNKFSKEAKLATVACTGSAFSIADPSDPGMMDFIGFDPSVPGLLVSLAESSLV